MDEEVRQLILMLDKRAAERERRAIRAHDETMAHLAELREDSRRQRRDSEATLQALLRVLDRLDNGGGAAPA